MAFLDLIAELTGTLPGLSPFLAEKYINRAWKDICDARRWSWLMTDGVLVCPGVITDGAAAITQYSASVTLDTDASAAVQDQITGAAEPGILQLQMRFGSSPALGGVYSIIAVDNTTPTAVVLTLDRGVQDDTDADSPYQIYRCYVTPPITDFLKWESVVDQANAIALTGDRLNLNSTVFDQRDPQRMSQGLAYWLGAFVGNRIADPLTGDTVPNATRDAGTPIYELWPHPTQGQVFYCTFRRSGAEFTQPTDELPPLVDASLVITRALAYHAYPFAMANVANFPSFKGANWPTLILTAKRDYQEKLQEAKLLDQDQQLQTVDVWNRGHGLRTGRMFGRYGDLGYPIDANYIQSHLVRF